MSTDERLPRCVVCRKSRTGDAYELADEEIERLENNGVYGVARVHRKYGAVPICADCLPGTGLAVEGAPGDDAPPLVRIVPWRTR